MQVAGAYAMYDGPRSPCTQTFGLGLFQMPTAGDMDQLETFFIQRSAPVIHEVSPLSDKTLLHMLNQRGYRPVELSNVMFMVLGESHASTPTRNEALLVRLAAADEHELWARIAAEGWREFGEIADLMLDLMKVSVAREDSASFFVEMDGQRSRPAALQFTMVWHCSLEPARSQNGAVGELSSSYSKVAVNMPWIEDAISPWCAQSPAAPRSAMLNAADFALPIRERSGSCPCCLQAEDGLN